MKLELEDLPVNAIDIPEGSIDLGAVVIVTYKEPHGDGEYKNSAVQIGSNVDLHEALGLLRTATISAEEVTRRRIS